MMTSQIQHLLSNSAVWSPDGVGGASSGGSTAPAGSGTSSPPAANDAAPDGTVGAHDSTVVEEEEDRSGGGDFFLGADSDDDGVAPKPAADGQAKPEPVKTSVTPGQQPQTAKPTPTTESTPPASPPASTTAEPVAVAAQPEPAKPGEVPKAPVSAGEPEKTLVQRIDESRDTVLKQLSTTRFKLTDEETAEFEAGDAQFVSKYGARVFFETFKSCAELIEQAVPGMIVNAIAASKAQQSADDEFYGGRQDLLPHRQKIFETARALRQVNPDMPKDQFLTLLETTSRAMLGVAAPVAPAQAPATGSTRRNGAAPHAPVVSSVPVGAKVPVAADGGDWGYLSDRLGET